MKKEILNSVIVRMGIATLLLSFSQGCNDESNKRPVSTLSVNQVNVISQPVPDTNKIPNTAEGENIRYGRKLIANTAVYIGPSGTAGRYLGNKMNCNNCHLDAGTRLRGLNFYNTFPTYPQYRGRENKVLTIADRINNCIERPHNGVPMPVDSKEMKAMVAYMKWVSENAPEGYEPVTDKKVNMELPEIAADYKAGGLLYEKHCKSCHGADGQGVWNADSSAYTYPPLWGKYAYQRGSSMHRVIKSANFIMTNMPYLTAMPEKPVLTYSEAINIAAFINNDSLHYRPNKVYSSNGDYPVSGVKPIDYDLAPYVDTFSERQHKYGPFMPIIQYHKAKNLKVIF
jgi:thiosulfate dehydrogenase